MTRKPPKPVSALEEALLLQIKVAQLPKPVREFRFCEARRWRADFAWPEQKVLVEVEGGIYSQGRHTRAAGYTADAEKYNEAQLLGFVVLRFTSPMVVSGLALATLTRALAPKP